jgi:hypothetical protein
MENSYLTSVSQIHHIANALTFQVYFVQSSDPKSALEGKYKMTALFQKYVNLG